MVLIIALAILTLTPCSVSGQVNPVEFLLEPESEIRAETALIELLEELLENPLNVNKAGINDLLSVPGITPDQAVAAFNHRNEAGQFNSLEEFRQSAGISSTWFETISGLFTVSASTPATVSYRQRAGRQIEVPRAFEQDTYAGSIYKHYARLIIRRGNQFEFGLVSEKDPGERDLADHSAGYLLWKPEGDNLKLIAGDFSLDFGQGLVFSRIGFSGKSAGLVSVASRKGLGLRGFRSSAESEYLRGGGLSIGYGFSEVTIFYSFRNRDAVLNSDGSVKGFRDTGYRRTETEISARDLVGERMTGANLRLNLLRSVTIGFTAAAASFSKKLEPDESDDVLFLQKGDRLRNYSADIRYKSDLFSFFGESAVSEPGSAAIAAGLMVSEENSKFLLHFRNYPEDYYSIRGNAFSDSYNAIRNEEGIYFSLNHEFSEQYEMRFYSDFYRRPWRTATTKVDRSLTDFFVQLTRHNGRDSSVDINWRRKRPLQEASITNEFDIERDYYIPVSDHRFRIQSSHFRRKLFFRIELRNRLSDDNLTGFHNSFFDNPGILGQVRFSGLERDRLRLAGAYSLFSSGNAVFYEYEPDLPGLFSMGQYSGDGQKLILLLSGDIGLYRITAKYSILHRFDRGTIGSGNSMIDRNYRQYVGLQLDLLYGK